MSDLIVARSEPVYLVPEGPARLTEYGKGWLDHTMAVIERFRATISDVLELGRIEKLRWPQIEEKLALEGVPVNASSGLSKYAMTNLINFINANGTAMTRPAVVAACLLTAAPTSTSTGSTGITEAAYTGYARVSAAASIGAASAADPSIALNSSAITFGNCTASSSTLLGFILTDSVTLAAGNALWYGTLVSTVISTTQTPPTIAINAMSLQMTGT